MLRCWAAVEFLGSVLHQTVISLYMNSKGGEKKLLNSLELPKTSTYYNGGVARLRSIGPIFGLLYGFSSATGELQWPTMLSHSSAFQRLRDGPGGCPRFLIALPKSPSFIHSSIHLKISINKIWERVALFIHARNNAQFLSLVFYEDVAGR